MSLKAIAFLGTVRPVLPAHVFADYVALRESRAGIHRSLFAPRWLSGGLQHFQNEAQAASTMIPFFVIPMWMNFLLRTYAWITLLGRNGVINRLLGFIGLGPLI